MSLAREPYDHPNKEFNNSDRAVPSAPRFPPTLPSPSSCLCAAPHRPSHHSEGVDLYAILIFLRAVPALNACAPDRYSVKWSYAETAHVVRTALILPPWNAIFDT